MLALSACGGPDFTGVWAGALTSAVTCNGTTTFDVGEVRWTLAHRGDDLTITPDGTCGSFTADVTGKVAVMRAKSCPSGAAFTSGRLEMATPDRLDIDFSIVNGPCDGRVTGVLDLGR